MLPLFILALIALFSVVFWKDIKRFIVDLKNDERLEDAQHAHDGVSVDEDVELVNQCTVA